MESLSEGERWIKQAELACRGPRGLYEVAAPCSHFSLETQQPFQEGSLWASLHGFPVRLPAGILVSQVRHLLCAIPGHQALTGGPSGPSFYPQGSPLLQLPVHLPVTWEEETPVHKSKGDRHCVMQTVT